MVFRISSILLWVFFSATALAGDPQLQVSLQPSRAQTYYIEGQFAGGKPSLFLLDTGSSYTVINKANLEKLQHEGTIEYLKELDGRLADGSRLAVPLYRVSTITLDGNCLVRDVEVAVFPNADRQILGLSTLRKLSPILFSIDPPSLTLSNCAAVTNRPFTDINGSSENGVAVAGTVTAELASGGETVPATNSETTAGPRIAAKPNTAIAPQEVFSNGIHE
ncbi:MAG: retroviral-like aspartic protease family protein [Gammaproteobacteria bacterium]